MRSTHKEIFWHIRKYDTDVWSQRGKKKLSVAVVFIFWFLPSDDCTCIDLINDRVMPLANQGWHYFLVYEHQRGSYKSQKVGLGAAEELK